MRTRIMNQLQPVALDEGGRRKKALWGKEGRAQLESFLLSPGPGGVGRAYWNCWID
jgi:hypothetical protein